jgi:hypothetical protein
MICSSPKDNSKASMGKRRQIKYTLTNKQNHDEDDDDDDDDNHDRNKNNGNNNK